MQRLVIFILVLWLACSYAESPHAIWIISDIHLDTATTHAMELAPYGRSSLNDLDTHSFSRLMESLRKGLDTHIVPEPEVILVLGDLVGHHRTSTDAVSTSQQASLAAIKQYFPDVPIAYTFGNNDAFAHNYGPFNDENAAFLSPKISCESQSSQYPCLLTENRADGYFSAYLYRQLRLISLNSVMFSWRAREASDAAINQQFEWLKTQLIDAHKKHEQVLLVMHIPPGDNVFDGSCFWKEELSDNFVKLLASYTHELIGVLAAHTHKDEIKILNDTDRNPVLGVYLNAALSTSHGNAPGMRVYELSQLNHIWQMDNYTSYQFASNGNLQKLYDFKNLYCQKGDKTVNDCLAHVTPEKVDRFFSAGNNNFRDKLYWPRAIYLTFHASPSWFDYLSQPIWNALAWSVQ